MESCPLIHLRLVQTTGSQEQDKQLVESIVTECLSNGLAVVSAKYLEHEEHNQPPPRSALSTCLSILYVTDSNTHCSMVQLQCLSCAQLALPGVWQYNAIKASRQTCRGSSTNWWLPLLCMLGTKDLLDTCVVYLPSSSACDWEREREGRGVERWSAYPIACFQRNLYNYVFTTTPE